MDFIISLILGAVGGNIGGMILKNYSLGTLGNSIAGIVGGGIGAQLLSGALGSGMVSQVAGGGVGGMILMVIIGIVKGILAKK